MANITIIGGSQAAVGATSEFGTVLEHPLGTRARDSAGNEYIYLQGVASVVVSDWVSFDEAHLTTRLVANGLGRVGVAMAAIVASNYGWFQIYGKATGTCETGFADNGAVYIHATAGSVDDTDVAGDAVLGAIGRSAISGTTATFELNYPMVMNISLD